ncbi:MAG: NUDIX hydrolase [Bacteroidota bacterium]
MVQNLNPHISVDCVVFGFNSQELMILLIDRDLEKDKKTSGRKKLPGNLIIRHELLEKSATRTLTEYTGLEDIYLRQFGVYDDPKRLSPQEDLTWLQQTSGMQVDRIVTISYYSLIKLDESKKTEPSVAFNAKWYPVHEIDHLKLIFDHRTIIHDGLQRLQQELLTEPLGYELLPEKFTLNQLQRLYEVILGMEIDNRNFRKRINRIKYIIPLNEFQKGVAHKPARLHLFDREKFEEFKTRNTGFII